MTEAVHDRVFHENTAIIRRPPVVWPDGFRLAFAVVVSVEYYEMQPPDNTFMPPNLPGGFGRAPYPDVRAFSMRAYGNRVGIFRVLDAFDRHQMRATAAVDASVATRYPYLLGQFQRRNWEIAAHGFSVNRVISNRMPEAEERSHIQSVLETITRESGARPMGWHGPEYGESERTPLILAENGVGYVLDWPNDEQPYLVNAPTGTIVSVPMALELDDVICCYHRRIGANRWRQAVFDAVDQLLVDSEISGRHLVLNLHPWFIGHPHRVGYLEDILDNVQQRAGVWVTTTGEIAAAYRKQLAASQLS